MARTAYNAHVLYDAHIPYDGIVPDTRRNNAGRNNFQWTKPRVKSPPPPDNDEYLAEVHRKIIDEHLPAREVSAQPETVDIFPLQAVARAAAIRPKIKMPSSKEISDFVDEQARRQMSADEAVAIGILM